MMRYALLLLVPAMWCFPAMGQPPPDYRVEVTTSGDPAVMVPVIVTLDDVDDDMRTVLRRADGGWAVCQTERDGDTLTATWMMPGGTTETCELRLSEEAPEPTRDDITVTDVDGNVEVTMGGEVFTRYVTDAGPKPYFYPVIGPTGAPLTRNYPMRDDVEGEAQDHGHHRSFWFTHDSVNGVNFWHEAEDAGRTVNRRYDALVSGSVYGRIRCITDWVKADGTKVCEDTRDVRIYNVAPFYRLMDFDIDWRASEGPLELGDTKEGVFGFRVASTMKVDAGQGHILNSAGHTDGGAWGKAAAWCDYYGPVEDEVVGIAIFDHPENPGHPTHWHVRTYGLFCANIFGLSYFEKDSGEDGSMTVPAGESLRFRYRVLMHVGTPEEADVAEAYAAYATPPKVTVTKLD